MSLKFNFKKLFIILILFVFTANILAFSLCNSFATTNQTILVAENSSETEDSQNANSSNSSSASVSQPDIIAEAAILIDSSSEKVLYSKNEAQKMYPASTTKIMTAILTIENCNLDDVVTVPYEAISTIPSGYSIAALQAGEQLTVNQLLQVLLVHSANDAANVLAYHVSGDIDTFAALMNKKVEELGLENTHFTNPSGQHDDNHYTTAHDLAIIMKYCMQNSTFRNLTKQKYCIIPVTNKYEERVFTSTNELLDASTTYYYQYAIGGKTGYTTEAKNCLISVSNKDDFELICVVLSCGLYENGLSAKFIDSRTLFNYGYDNYSIQKLREQDAIATQIEVAKGTKDTKNLDLLIQDDIYAIIPNSDLDTDFEPEIILKDDLSAPIALNEVVGTITYKIDGLEYSSNLIASHSVEKSNFITLIIRILLIFFILLCVFKLLTMSTSKKKSFEKKSKRSRHQRRH